MKFLIILLENGSFLLSFMLCLILWANEGCYSLTQPLLLGKDRIGRVAGAKLHQRNHLQFVYFWFSSSGTGMPYMGT